MACGNGKVSREGLGSQPRNHSPLKDIHLKLPKDGGPERLRADIWTTAHGEFVDKPGVQRKFQGVNSGEGRWDFKPDPDVVYVDKKIEPYTHMTARAGWLGPQSLLEKLPPDARKKLEERRVIVLGRNPDQLWVNEHNTATNSRGPQKTVIRPAKVIFKPRQGNGS